MNPYERAELEAENDGYRNELQRAFALSAMERVRIDERPKALELVSQGKTVVLEHYQVHCQRTDAVLGEDTRIRSIGDDYESAVGPVLNMLTNEEDPGDSRYEVLPTPPSIPQPVVEVVEDEDVPF